jgi:putative peptide zinc metalloprotease protein
VTDALLAPAPAPGLELLGPLGGSGYRRQQALVRRADGQTVQLTPVLYALVELLDGERGPEELADALSESIGKRATAQDVVLLLERLRPLGLLDGPEAEAAPRPQPLLGLRLRYVVTDPVRTRRLTAPFAWLFRTWVVVPVLAVFFGVCWFVLVDKGLASATRQAFLEPEKLLAVFALTVVTAGFHEFGHAAACRYGGATPGAMGAGLYLVWPAFYTDVADSYRLSRWGRLRVDLGGLYFNAVAAVGVWGLWLLWRQDALLLAVAMQLLQMVRQLPPVIRADGYHIVADLTGVPDLYHHLGPTLRRLLPWHWGEASPLRRRARWIVTAWTLAVVPVLAAMVLTGILLFPRLVATAWEGGHVQAARLQTWDPVVAGAALLKLVALVLPVLSVSFMAWQLLRRMSRRVWHATEEHPRRRAAVIVVGLVAALVLGSLWWPDGQYKPVRADERGTVLSLVGSGSAAPVPTSREQVPALALVPRDDKTAPVLLLLPGEDGGTTQAVLTTAAGQEQAASGTTFPFRLPSAPRPGDNQALAVGDEDGKTVYDVAYAVVTVTDGSPVTNANQAFAFASCTACTTVAVAFQVVLVIGQADVVAPVNTAVAGNADCISCVTTALAVQLVVTLQELPTQDVYDKLQAALAGLDGLGDLDPAELLKAVGEVEAQVVGILVDAGLVDNVTTATASASATPQATSATTQEPQASASATTEPSSSPTPEAAVTSAPAEASPTPTPTPSG